MTKSLSSLASRTGQFILYVNAGQSSGQDWAAWAEAKIETAAPPALPDLETIDVLSADGQICYSVKNVGNASTGGAGAPASFYNALLINGQKAAEDQVTASLAPGEQLNRCFNYQWSAIPGQHIIRVCADQPPPPAPQVVTEPPGKPTSPPPEPQEGVYLNPPFIEAQPGQRLSIEIKVKPSGWGVIGGEINLVFNPDIIKGVNIESGSFLGSSPIVGLKQMDNQAGTVRLALARVGVTSTPSPPGILAKINYKVLDSATSGTYDLKLTKVGLADENFQDITDVPIQGSSIKISP